MFKTILSTLLFTGLSSMFAHAQQASLTVKNKSDRELTIKVMKGTERKSTQFKTDIVPPKGTRVFYFNESGYYFTKTQGILFDKEDPTKNDTLYSQDRPFQVTSDSKKGYSNITMEYKTKKAHDMDPNSVQITRREYDTN